RHQRRRRARSRIHAVHVPCAGPAVDDRELVVVRRLGPHAAPLRPDSSGPRAQLPLIDHRGLLAAERGTLHKEAELRIALMYPSPYRAAMSSLGYQQIYRTLHDMPGVAADRAMLGDKV